MDQKGIDLSLRVSGPDGQELFEIDSTQGTRGVEPVCVLAEVSGGYCLDVRSVEKTAPPGRYALKTGELRLAIPQDENRTAAQEAFVGAERLRKQGTAASLRTALGKYREAILLAQAAEDRRRQAIALLRAGLVQTRLAEHTQALDSYRQALALWQTIADRQGEANALNDIGLVYRNLWESQRALDYYHQALSLARVVQDRDVEAAVLANIGVTYTDLGDHRKALGYFHKALPLDRHSGPWQESITLNNIGFAYRNLKEFEKAFEHYNQALILKRQIGDRRGEANTLNNIGSVYFARGEPKKALEYYNLTLPLIRSTGDRRIEIRVLSNLGAIWSELRDERKAIEYLHEALALSRTTGDSGAEASAMVKLAQVERDRGNLREARAQLETALKIVESLRTKVSSQDLRASYFASARKRYELYVNLLMALHHREPSAGYDRAALEASERARARSLLELLAEARADIREGVGPALLERERSVQRQLNAKAQAQMRLLGGKHTDEQAEAVAREIEALTAEYELVEVKIRAESPRYAALMQPEPLGIALIQKDVLDADTLLLEYWLGEDRSFLWAVSQTSVASFELPKRAEIETAARSYYSSLAARPRRARPGAGDATRPAVSQSAAALSRMLLSPVAELLGTKRLLVVADGALQYVPFAALPAPAAESGVEAQPLLVNHEIVSVPSASVLAALRREVAGRRPASRTLAVLADPVFDPRDRRIQSGPAREAKPSEDIFSAMEAERSATDLGLLRPGGIIPRLPFTRREALAISALAPEGSRMQALDFAANRTTATDPKLGQYRFIHFATHALINSEHPELSGILLSMVNERGEPQNGFLRLHDVYNLRLPADVVVLSACQTALGREIQGEGLVGLTRGFLYAGAERVVASLWKVDDVATAELMKRFYGGILGSQKLRPAAALRAAQLAVWKQKRWAHPYFWAPFLLQGEWN